MTKTGLQSHLLRNTALALVLGAGLVGCSDGSDSYFGWGDPGAWYESASPGEGDPNLEGATVPGDRLPEPEQTASGPGLDMGSTDEGVTYADNDVRGSDSGTIGSNQSMAMAAPTPEPSPQEPSPLIAGARDLGAMPPAPKMEPAEEKADAAGTMEVASSAPEATNANYTPIPGTRTLSGMRPKGSLARSMQPAKDADGNIIAVARLMDRGNANIPGPMPFAGNDGTVTGYPTKVGPGPNDLAEPMDVRTAEVKEPPAPSDNDMPSVLPSGPGGTATASASASAQPSDGPRSIGQYLNGDSSADTPMRAAPLKSSDGGASALASSPSRPPLVPIASGEDSTTLEASMAGSFDQDYNAVSGGTLDTQSVTVDMTALDARHASVPQELLEDLNSEFGGGSATYNYTRSDLQFDGMAPVAAPTTAVVQRQETLAALIPADQAGAKPSGAYIPFALGSVRLSSNDRAAITKLAGMVSGSNRVIHIIGHAADPAKDTHGGVRGFELSLERANKVAAALVAAGVPHNQIRVEARGVTGARRADLYIR